MKERLNSGQGIPRRRFLKEALGLAGAALAGGISTEAGAQERPRIETPSERRERERLERRALAQERIDRLEALTENPYEGILNIPLTPDQYTELAHLEIAVLEAKLLSEEAENRFRNEYGLDHEQGILALQGTARPEEEREAADARLWELANELTPLRSAFRDYAQELYREAAEARVEVAIAALPPIPEDISDRQRVYAESQRRSDIRSIRERQEFDYERFTSEFGDLGYDRIFRERNGYLTPYDPNKTSWGEPRPAE